MLFIAVPTIALIGLIGMLVWSDAQSLLELRRFHVVSEDIAEMVEARASVQAERHQLIDDDPNTPQNTNVGATDLFGAEANKLRYARDFAEARNPDSPGMNRLYVVESGTGTLCRVALASSVAETGSIAAVTSSSLQLATPLSTPPTPGTRFRINRSTLTGLTSSPSGITHSIAVQVPLSLGQVDDIYFRVSPSDATAGTGVAVQTVAAKDLKGGPYVSPQIISDGANLDPQYVSLGDLNGDGNPDMVCANPGTNSLTVFFQEAFVVEVMIL